MSHTTLRRIITRPTTWLTGMAALFAMVLLLFPHWTVDDAYISLRYAENLVRYGQLTWNIGEAPIEGYTGILWTLLAAGAIWIHLPPLMVLNLVGLISTLVMLELVDQILLALDTDMPRRLLARGLLVTGGFWAMHTMSGLETMLYSALIVASVLAWLRRSPWLPLICLLCALTRPEGALLAVVLIGASWWRRTLHLTWLLTFVVPGGAYFLWRWSYYGQLLPNTFYVKGLSGSSSWVYVWYFLVLAVIPLVWAWYQSGPQLARLAPWRNLVVCLGGFISILLLFYGQSELMMNYSNRFMQPLQPLIIVGLVATWGTISLRSVQLAAYVLLNAICLLGGGINAYYYELMEREEHTAAATWITSHLPPNATLMTIVDAGLVPYRTSMRTIDAGGLNDVYLAHTRDPYARADYLLNQQADVILMATGDLGSTAAEATRVVMLTDPRWQQYHLVQTFRRQTQFDYHQEVWVHNGTSLRGHVQGDD
jgi:arabinofuranosyltransferase